MFATIEGFKMSAKRNLFVGCGVGCATVILALVIGGAFVGNYFKDKLDDFSSVDESNQQLVDKYGAVEDYCPPADGIIIGERIRTFLAIQDSLSTLGSTLIGQWQVIENTDENNDKSFKDVVELAKSGIGFVGIVGEYLSTRNSAQLTLDMSPGEYSYIYTIAYHSWLHLEAATELEILDIDSLRDHYKKDVGRKLALQLENQLAIMMQTDPLYSQLVEEIELMKNDSNRTPWQDGLPILMLNALEPYRYDLENSYRESASMFGIGLRTELDDEKFRFEIN
jgi:hypothetical protein